MIQDRLTAKFRTVLGKPARKSDAKPKARRKVVVAPVADSYTKGRQISGSFWI